MPSLATQLATQLSEALSEEAIYARYERAIVACDEAWDAVEGALESGFIHLAREAHEVFREAYAKKCWLHAQWRKAL